MDRITIINGPNLNLLGTREPEVYGSVTFAEFFDRLQKAYAKVHLAYAQSNVEGEIIDLLHKANEESEAVILNAAGYTHTSIAIADAVAAISIPVVEVHISNVFAREEFRHHSMLSGKCVGSISGLGLKGYELALQYLLEN